MFTGIVETVGKIIELCSADGGTLLNIESPLMLTDTKVGDSIAVNGACLTVTDLMQHAFNAMVVPETLAKTNLGELQKDAPVNLERAMRADGRFDGHMVQGHIETTTSILNITEQGEEWLVHLAIPKAFEKYIVPKGFITVDGMSLTIIDVTPEWFSLMLIPHTRAVTVAQYYRVGTKINLETDIIGRYIERLTWSR